MCSYESALQINKHVLTDPEQLKYRHADLTAYIEAALSRADLQGLKDRHDFLRFSELVYAYIHCPKLIVNKI